MATGGDTPQEHQDIATNDEGKREELELTSNNAINTLSHMGFQINRYWNRLSSVLGVPLDERIRHERLAVVDKDYHTALESCIDYWITNESNSSMEKLLEAARAVENERTKNPAIIILCQYHDKLLHVLDKPGILSSDLITRLQAESVIKKIPDDMKPISIEDLLKMVKESVTSLPKCLLTFTDVLKKFGSRECFQLSNEIVDEYEHFSTLPSSLVSPDVSSPILVPVSPTFESKFDEMMFRYGAMTSKAQKIIQKNFDLSKLSDMKKFLENSKLFSVHDVQTCDSIEAFLKLVINKCSVLNVSCLKYFFGEFQIAEGSSEIESYLKDLDSFCKELHNKLTLNRPFFTGQQLRCETITFVLQWDPKETPIDHIRKLLYKAFEDLSDKVHVQLEKEGSSIIVTCYAPHTVMGLLVMKAQKNLDSLKEEGVLSLSIGYCTLLNHKTGYEVGQTLSKDVILLKQEKEELQSEIQSISNEFQSIRIAMEKEKHRQEIESQSAQMISEFRSELDSKKIYIAELEQRIEEFTLPTEDGSMKERALQKTVSVLIQKKQELEKKERDLREHYESSRKEMKERAIELMDFKRQLSEAQESNKKKLQEKELFISDLKNKLEIHKKISDVKTKEFEYLKGSQSATERLRLKSEIQSEKELRGEEAKQKEYLATENEKLKNDIERLERDAKEYEQQTQKQNNRLITELEEMKASLLRRIPTISNDWKDPHAPPAELLMTNYSEYRKKNKRWFSPSFYSHPRGYEMCLEVNASGDDNAYGTHMSMYIHLMQGLHDAELHWPFEGDVKLKLLNRRTNDKHYEKIFTFDRHSNIQACRRVYNGILTDTGMASSDCEGFGFFIPHSDLPFNSGKGTEYLKDDILKIQIEDVNIKTSSVTADSPLEDETAQTPLVLTIKNFSKQKNEWTSPPFYSHPNGYKFVLLGYPNGRGSGQGKYVSAFVHLMKGEYDDKLKFPFRGEIALQIMNTIADEGHVQRILSFDESTDPDGSLGGRSRVFSRAREGLGFNELLAHKDLPFNAHRNTQYIDDNDCLHFRIICRKVSSSPPGETEV